ncbi:MAG: endopeptidase La [Candidatus Fluviicola riflensis]|nr:MAG: endopeptidase La [Candidatus Fluviicola riflensis]OGS78949.1 MAG: endopeptidase La [Candidatus Fluviicola riflensis]OGS85971.1 MAG: endopeptidase La [Fluviicola sp. RIFCSPHIGHO2_12_FULL_43_24]OGS86380.1 MAG: endopeptidase La [Fluviicola sp. RIFCSPHIGHO2_01_FULL_43_53]
MKDSFEHSLILSADIDEHADFLPLMSPDEEENMNKEIFPEDLPILPLRNNVLFPGVMIPITVGRDKSIRLIQEAHKGNRIIGVVSQLDQEEEAPEFVDLHKVGTVAQIIRMLKMPDGSSTVIIQGKRRFEIVEPYQTEPYMRAKVRFLVEEMPAKKDAEMDLVFRSIKDLALQIIRDSPNIPSEASFAIGNIESPTFMVNFISSNMNADVNKKQGMLEELNFRKRAKMVMEHLTLESQLLEMRNEIQSKVRQDMDRQQREYFLNQQIRTIQDELGDNPQEQDVRDMETRASKKKWDKKMAKLFKKELDKLQRMNPQGAEYTVQLNYLDTLLDLPWNEFSTDNLDLKRAAKILERDHFGLEKVKERILEYLAVLKLKGDMKSPILCFYGPPGVGKTSLGKSIAEALGRNYVRMSLGGVHDEAEIRGHRKTYIGAMPGRVIQHIKKAGSANPVFVLDEVDKLGRSNHGDPSSALLEVLDPEQNNAFYDNYVETEFDLSKVMFIATANSLSTIQSPLLDRMEIIEVNGYTVEEKIEIGKNHLLPKQLEAHGITKKHLTVDKKTLERIVEQYTNESGVRGLDKQLAKLSRHRAKQVAIEEEYEVKVELDQLQSILGPGREKTRYDNNDVPGVVTGLAWTSVGGDILFIESSLTKGKGKLTLTGNLGDVMKESAIIALEFLKSHSDMLGLTEELFDETNVHIHVPEGATPKDGPSAGITMLTSLASSFSKRKVKKNLAMTGEITLRGEVLPVGGIKEKILAAKRANIKEIILCERNRRDIEEITADYVKGLTFHYVKSMREVLDLALEKAKK